MKSRPGQSGDKRTRADVLGIPAVASEEQVTGLYDEICGVQGRRSGVPHVLDVKGQRTDGADPEDRMARRIHRRPRNEYAVTELHDNIAQRGGLPVADNRRLE